MLLILYRCKAVLLPITPYPLQIVAFIRGWDLSLVVLAAIPALILAGGVCGVFTAKLQVGTAHACETTHTAGCRVELGALACTVAGICKHAHACTKECASTD